VPVETAGVASGGRDTAGPADSITITITGLTYDGNSGDFWQTGREYTYKCGKLAGVGPEWRSKFA
jgi:hypothetical protein